MTTTLVRRKSRNSPAASPKRTFLKKSLEAAFLEYCQLSMEPGVAEVDQHRLAELTKEAQDHISNEHFWFSFH